MIDTIFGSPLEELRPKTLQFINKSTNTDPTYAHEGDSGIDMRAWITEDNGEIVLKPLERKMIHTGIYFNIPKNTEIQIRPRSGCAIKQGLSLINAVATIDENYRGEICILAVNISNENITMHNGDRIAQAVLCPVYNSHLTALDKIENFEDTTNRGENGFGSSGIN